MHESQHYQVLSLLKARFPNAGKHLDDVYWLDAEFRQIAREYQECIRKQEMEIEEGTLLYLSYSDTIAELKEELLEHLKQIS